MKNLKNEEAMTYIYNRKIPQNKLKLLFYCENFYSELYIPLKKMIKTVEQEEFEVKFIPKTDPRIFWFIKDRKNNIIGIQGRSILTGTKMRYLTVKITDDVMVGNLENIKLNEPIHVTEGFFDSLFLPNCVSLNCGSFKATVNTLLELKAKHIIVIFDNEPKNEQILKKINEVINLSIQITKNDTQIGVTLLPKNLRPIGKDINEYIKQNISNSKILNIIRDNTHYGMNAKIQLLRWI